MNIIYLGMTFKMILSKPLAFFTLGIFGSGPEKSKADQDVLENVESVPHIWYMSLQLTLVLLYANADINSRVASTLPIYFWAFASMAKQRKDGKVSKLGRFACL